MKMQLGVFFGGKSVEHEISIISAVQAILSMNREKYDIIPIYITKQNEMYVGEGLSKIENYRNLPALLKTCTRVTLVRDGKDVQIMRYPAKKFGGKKNILGHIDVAFPIVHGTNVEDGTLQGYLKMLDLPYVGCDVYASAAGMDKYMMKTVFKDCGVPVLDCVCMTAAQYGADPEAVIAKVEGKFPYPVIVKPVNLGSSIGITKADDKDALTDALNTAFSYAQKVLVEPAIVALREINCAVLGDVDEARASLCEEPVGSDEILSFTDKYMSGGSKNKTGGSKGMASTQRKIPADLSPEQTAEIQVLAVKAFQCLGCNGVARIDFMIDKDSGKVWLNEINTIPGSLSFYLWEPMGLPYAELLDEMVSLALKRHREENAITYSFDSNVLAGVSLGGTKGSKR